MITKLKTSLGLTAAKAHAMDRSRLGIYTPERPINFVRRSDPNFYFLAKR